MPARSHPRRSWTRLPDHKLLALRMCDLDLVLERSPVWPRIERLYPIPAEELEKARALAKGRFDLCLSRGAH